MPPAYSALSTKPAFSTVNHPNILTIHDVGAQGDLHSLVSELLEGQTLREKMNAGPLSQRRVTEYARTA